MNKQSWLLNLSLLKTHPAFRAVFLARFISIVSLGLLGVAVPVQIQMMTHSTWQRVAGRRTHCHQQCQRA